MKDTMYNIIVKGIYAICFVLCVICLFKVAYQLTKANQMLKEYNSYSVQYDTTSTYNQIKIYDKMKELEDSLYGMDYSIFCK